MLGFLVTLAMNTQDWKFSILYKSKDDMLHCFFYSLNGQKKALTLEEHIAWSCDVMFCLETVSFRSNDDHDNAKLKKIEGISMEVRVEVEVEDQEEENENLMVVRNEEEIGKQFKAIVVDNGFASKNCFSLVGGNQPHCEDESHILKYTILASDMYPNTCIHEVWVQSLMEVAVKRKIPLWQFNDGDGGTQEDGFMSMPPILISIVKGVFKGMLNLHKQRYRIKKECFNANHVVFTNSENLCPKIIDCLIKTEIEENGFPNFEPLSQLIDSLKDIWISDPEHKRWEPWPPTISPFVASFQDMLKIKNAPFEYFEQLLYHPLLMTFEERLEYLERVRDVISGHWLRIYCNIKDVLGPGIRAWRQLLYVGDEILSQQFNHDYNDGQEWTENQNNVITLLIFLRNVYKHWNEAEYKDSKEYLGRHLSFTCPRLLPELFWSVGHLHIEEKIDVPKTTNPQPKRSREELLLATSETVKEWWRMLGYPS